MLISKLLTGIKYTTKQSDIIISSITNDTRQIQKDSLFVCMKGLKFDGHSLAHQALNLGAVAVLCEQDLGLENQILVPNTREAYAILCANFFGNPSKSLKLIGVTGTNGKTTITYLLKHILEATGKKVGLIGTIQNEIGDMVLPAKHTTPDPFQLHAIFAQMKEAQCEYVVMEVSSHAMDQHRLDGCQFCAGVFINLTQDHLDYHGTMDDYYLAKKKLFSISDVAIVNIDDAYGQKLKQELNIPVLTFSINQDCAAYTAKNIEFDIKGSKFAFVGDEKIARVHIPMPGEFSVSNAMAAITCCLSIGIELDDIVKYLAFCNGITGRCEIIQTNTEFTVIRDYAHTHDGLEKVIGALKKIAPARVITLFGAAGNRDRDKRKYMGEVASRLSDFVILTSDNPRDEDVLQIIADTQIGMKSSSTPYKVIANRYDAIIWGLENAQKGDIVLLAGKGHETYQVLDYGTIFFDEKLIVLEALGKLNHKKG